MFPPRMFGAKVRAIGFRLYFPDTRRQSAGWFDGVYRTMRSVCGEQHWYSYGGLEGYVQIMVEKDGMCAM